MSDTETHTALALPDDPPKQAEAFPNATPRPWKWSIVADRHEPSEDGGRIVAAWFETTAPNPRHNDPVIFAVREDWIGHLMNSPEGRANAALIVAAVNAYDPTLAADNAALGQRVETLAAALKLTLESMRELRGMAFTGSRIPYERYPEKKRADAADEAARAALAESAS